MRHWHARRLQLGSERATAVRGRIPLSHAMALHRNTWLMLNLVRKVDRLMHVHCDRTGVFNMVSV